MYELEKLKFHYYGMLPVDYLRNQIHFIQLDRVIIVIVVFFISFSVFNQKQ